ncbi:MAG: Elongation factor P [Candidatus Omnitrophica bacterium ADurb.Bin292]|jgi:elongation factor P|nr:MAG: Elongation factor P [Candidatus Omnitrophica bacterium ADurb.Bin292]HPW76726.1 elongation factor P [Candidatus Omnitrophota bacterium]HQB12515.1 elongation factor P [Candidatus Omnitrophota bacterium]
MSQVPAKELEKKLYIYIDGTPYWVLDVKFASPTARGASTMAKARVRNLLTGAVLDKTFSTTEKFDLADVEKIPVVFLYASGDEYCFMDNSTYEQFSISAAKLGEQRFYLKENFEAQALKLNGSVVSLELPVYVELAVTETDPGLKGATAQGRSLKNAKLETGIEVQVPSYIEIGDKVRVNTETGEVSGRA